MRKDYVPTIVMHAHKYKELVSWGYLDTSDYKYEVVDYGDDIRPIQVSRVSRYMYDKTPEIVNVVMKGGEQNV